MNGKNMWIRFYIVSHILYSTLLSRYISSKFEPSFGEEINMEAGFGGVHQYDGWLVFTYKVTSKIRFAVLLGERGGFMGEGVGLWKMSEGRFLFQNWFMSGP